MSSAGESLDATTQTNEANPWATVDAVALGERVLFLNQAAREYEQSLQTGYVELQPNDADAPAWQRNWPGV